MNPINLIQAFRKGQELTNVTTWKVVQATAGSLTVVIKAVLFLLPMFGIDTGLDGESTEALISHLADGIANILFVVTLFLVPATTKKIGILPKKIEGD